MSSAFSDAARGAKLLQQADTRLDEVGGLLASSADVSQIESTLKDFRSSAGEGADLLFRSYQGGGSSTEISRVHKFTSKQSTALDAMSAEAPPTASDAFSSAAGIVEDIEQQARVLCVACGQGAPLALADALDPASVSLETLLVQPAEQTVPADVEALRQKAEKVSAEAGTTPPASSTEAVEAPTTSVPPQVIPKVTEAVGNEAVTKLLNSIGAKTPLAPVTSSLGKAVDDTVGSLNTTLNGLLAPKK